MDDPALTGAALGLNIFVSLRRRDAFLADKLADQDIAKLSGRLARNDQRSLAERMVFRPLLVGLIGDYVIALIAYLECVYHRLNIAYGE